MARQCVHTVYMYVRAVHVHVYMHILRAVRGVRLCGVACVRRDLATHLTEDKSCMHSVEPQQANARAPPGMYSKTRGGDVCVKCKTPNRFTCNYCKLHVKCKM